MRNRSTYREKPVSSPIMVERGIDGTGIELHERMLVQAFSAGYADTSHFDGLSNMRNVMVLAAHYKKDKAAINVCEGLHIVLSNMRDHYNATGKMEAKGDDMEMIYLFADAYRNFWMRQNMNLFRASLLEANNILNESKGNKNE